MTPFNIIFCAGKFCGLEAPTKLQQAKIPRVAINGCASKNLTFTSRGQDERNKYNCCKVKAFPGNQDVLQDLLLL